MVIFRDYLQCMNDYMDFRVIYLDKEEMYQDKKDILLSYLPDYVLDAKMCGYEYPIAGPVTFYVRD